jgi:hypothetical protein
MAPAFYFSYSRDDYSPELLEFWRDLEEEVRARLALSSYEQASFFDQRQIELGQSWDRALVEALQTSKALVSVCTPRYFRRKFCGKEVQFFLERQRLVPGAVTQPFCPVLWFPMDGPLPSPFDTLQFADSRFPPEYLKEGLRYLRKLNKKKYQQVVFALGEVVSAAATRSPELPPLPGSLSLDEIADAFESNVRPVVVIGQPPPPASSLPAASQKPETSAKPARQSVPPSTRAESSVGPPPAKQAVTPARFFICYRRDESSCYAGWLNERMNRHFGEGQVFMDLDSIEPGEDFERAIERTLSSCEGLVVLIGKKWLTLKGADGQPRLADANDYVRREIAVGLANNIRVVPILLDSARMPLKTQLPDDLQLLPTRNAIQTEASRFIADTDRLIKIFENKAGQIGNG